MELTASDLARTRQIARGAARRLGRPELRDDFEGAAMEGLAQAARSWNGTGNFWAWAGRRIFGAIRDEYRRFDHLTRDHRKAITDGEEKETLAPISAPIPVETLIRDTEGLTWMDRIRDPEPTPDESVVADGWVASVLRLLPRREAEIIALLDIGGFTVVEVAESYGVSQGRISQLRHRAYKQLRPLLGA